MYTRTRVKRYICYSKIQYSKTQNSSELVRLVIAVWYENKKSFSLIKWYKFYSNNRADLAVQNLSLLFAEDSHRLSITANSAQ